MKPGKILVALAASFSMALASVGGMGSETVHAQTNARLDREVLEIFYRSTGGDNWDDNTNWLSARPIGEWHGVTVDAAGRVTELWLSWNGLRGEMPSELGDLTKLRVLNLDFNNWLSGPIPSELGNLSNLEILSLRQNQMSGEIPPELGNLSNLGILDLFSNDLNGRIPPQLGNLANLEILSLGQNEWTGGIPSELESLKNLRLLNIRLSDLTGEIPPWLGNLLNLEFLQLEHNQLSGKIPTELGRLTNLTELDLIGNRLTGEVPAELANLPSLKRLALYGNELSGGGFPSHPSDRTVLATFYNATNGGNWSNNDKWLSDSPIVTWNGVVTDGQGRVVELDLWSNGILGEIPPELSSLSNLRILELRGNSLSGEIPSELGNLTNLEALALSQNRLTGEIPPELGNLPNLRFLLLRGNQLSGCIPAGLRGVLINDLDELGLAFCEKLLSGLQVTPHGLIQPFDPYHSRYTVAVLDSRVTIVPETPHPVTILFLHYRQDAAGNRIEEVVTDADPAMPGHQVDFSHEVPYVLVHVTFQGEQTSREYLIWALGILYDADEDGAIDRDEVIEGIEDYFADRLSRDEVIGLIELYFQG